MGRKIDFLYSFSGAVFYGITIPVALFFSTVDSAPGILLSCAIIIMVIYDVLTRMILSGWERSTKKFRKEIERLKEKIKENGKRNR